MTKDEKIAAHKQAWVRQIAHVTGYREQAAEIVRLAQLNGLFDVLNVAFDRAPPPGSEG